MTESADDARGVTMRVSRKLRNVIQRIQRTESFKQKRNLTVVEASEMAADIIEVQYPDTNLSR